MVCFESPGIQLPWWRSALYECSCFDYFRLIRLDNENKFMVKFQSVLFSQKGTDNLRYLILLIS